MKKILITGGSGYLGSHLVKYYIDKGWSVYSLARNEFRQWQLKQRFPKVNIILGDVRYFDGKLEPDVIIHTGAMKHVLFCQENEEEAYDINVNGTNNMIEWAHVNKVKDFILISSDKAIEPTTLYGTTKEQAEKITRGDVADSLKGLPQVKMHCSNLASEALKKAIQDYEKKKKLWEYLLIIAGIIIVALIIFWFVKISS